MSPNFDEGRGKYKPEAIVIHRSEGSFESSKVWCLNKKSKVSYHVLIDEKGYFEVLVDPKDTAWHAGLVKNASWPLIKAGINPNRYTIGVALSGFASTKPTIPQIMRCAEIIKELCKDYEIPLDKNHIIPHNAIRSDKICPGVYVELLPLIYLAGL